MRKVLHVLGQMTDQDIDWLAQAGARRKIAAGTVIITQGQAMDSLYILLEGSVSVEVKGIGEVAKLGSGEIFGEMSFIDHRLPSATVKAVSDCLVLDLPRAAVRRKLEQDVGFSARFHRALARFLSDRLVATMRKLAGPQHDTSFDDEADGEVDLELLGDVHLAGMQFDRMLKKLVAP